MDKVSLPYLDGWFTHKQGLSRSDADNPYSMETQYASYLSWRTGWYERANAVERCIYTEHDNWEPQ